MIQHIVKKSSYSDMNYLKFNLIDFIFLGLKWKFITNLKFAWSACIITAERRFGSAYDGADLDGSL